MVKICFVSYTFYSSKISSILYVFLIYIKAMYINFCKKSDKLLIVCVAPDNIDKRYTSVPS